MNNLIPAYFTGYNIFFVIAGYLFDGAMKEYWFELHIALIDDSLKILN